MVYSTLNDLKKVPDVVLVIVAHSDDETLGLGGTIARHVEYGDTVFAISMTNGVGARGDDNIEEINKRESASAQAAAILGFTWLHAANFPDNAMDTVPLLSVVKVIENAKNVIKPNIVYTHSNADLNVDHRIVSEATLVAFRPQPNEIFREIRVFEVPSATDYGHRSITNIFYPNLYVDIQNHWDKKKAALIAYESEMRDSPHSRSLIGLENLARLRGNQVGLNYAEAFEIIRRIER